MEYIYISLREQKNRRVGTPMDNDDNSLPVAITLCNVMDFTEMLSENLRVNAVVGN